MYSGIIMASGYSSRLENREKLLMVFKGRPLLEHVLIAAQNSALDEILLIYRKTEIEALGRQYRCKTVYNAKAEKGQSEAFRLGIQTASSEVSAYVFMVGDQPFLNEYLINRLIKKYEETGAKVVFPVYRDREKGELRGTPVLFSADLKYELLTVSGDKGGRGFIDKYYADAAVIYINDSTAAVDIDTWEDFIAWR